MPSDAPERVFLWFREPAHPIAFSQPQVDDKGDPWPEYVRADLLAARDADLTAAREALRLAVPIVTSDLEQWEMADEFTPEYRRKGMGMATTALRAIVAILPDALDGAPEWIVEAVKQEKPDAD